MNRAGFPRRGGSDSSCLERSPLGGTGVKLGRGEPEAAGRRSALGEDRGACAADPGHCGEGPPAMRRRAPCVAAPPSPAPLSLPWNRRATARWCWIRPPIGCPSGSQAARPVGQPLATRRRRLDGRRRRKWRRRQCGQYDVTVLRACGADGIGQCAHQACGRQMPITKDRAWTLGRQWGHRRTDWSLCAFTRVIREDHAKRIEEQTSG